MVKVKIKATQESFDTRKEDTGDFALPKPGYYVLTCVNCEPENAKGEDGEPDESRPYLNFTYKITGVGVDEAEVTENYGQVWDVMSFSEKSDFKRAEVLLAYGIASEGGEFTTDTDDFINRKVLSRLKHEKGQTKDDPKRAKVARLFPYGSAPGAEEAEVVYGDEETEDVFGAASEELATGYTEEALQELSLKELGAILKDDFAGEPRDHIVKDTAGKVDNDATATAVITAILLAQNGGAAPADADDGDPF